MSSPTIVGPISDPIEIDPYVVFKYVIPAQLQTSLGYVPRADFTITISGNTLSVAYTGAFISADTIFPVVIFASNSDGTVEQTLNFKVRARETVTQAEITRLSDTYSGNTLGGSFINGSADWTLANGIAPNAVLAVGDRIKFHFNSGPSAPVANTLYWVKAVTSTTFQVSLTNGGAAITAVFTGSAGDPYAFQALVAVTQAASDVIWVGDSSRFAADQPVQFFAGSVIFDVVSSVFAGPVYVKTIVDSSHVKVAATIGGAALVQAATNIPGTSGNTGTFGWWTYSARRFPVVTSAGSVSGSLGSPLSHTVTTDLTSDVIFAQGLPQGLTFSAGVISGSSIESGFFAITLRAVKGAYSSERYLVLNLSGSSEATLDLIINTSDEKKSGLLTLVDGQVSGGVTKLPTLTRNDGERCRFRFVRETSAGVYEDIDLSSATVRTAIGLPDQPPSAGTVYLKVGSSLTSGTLASGKRYLIVTFVSGDVFTNVGAGSNATGIIFTASGTTPTTWTHASTLQEITADLAIDASETAVATALNATKAVTDAGGVSVTKPAAGSYAVAFTTFGSKVLLGGNADSAAPLSIVSVSRVQVGSAGVKEIQVVRLVQNPYCFATLSVPYAFAPATGPLSLSTYGLFQAFAATAAKTLTFTLEVEIQFAGQQPRTVLQTDVVISRDVIDLNNLIPATLPYGYTAAQADAKFAPLANVSPVFHPELTETGLLPNVPTTTLPSRSLISLIDTSGDGEFVVYAIYDDSGNGAAAPEDSQANSGQPNESIVPNDYDPDTNCKVWVLIQRIYLAGPFGNIILPENANFQFGTDPANRAILLPPSLTAPRYFTHPDASGTYMIRTMVPASAGAAGSVGQFASDSNYFYVCTATNTWKRTAIATW